MSEGYVAIQRGEGCLKWGGGGSLMSAVSVTTLKVHKIENFFGSEFEFYTISLLVMLKY